MAIARADRFTKNDIQVTFWSDVNPTFKLNPITGNVPMVTNEDSIKQSVFLLMMTQIGERPCDSITVGSIIRQLMFEPDDPLSVSMLQNTIRTTLGSQEPRITVLDIQVAIEPMQNAVAVDAAAITIIFSIKNINTISNVTIFLRRVR